MKTCNTCKVSQPLECFPPDKRLKSGHQGQCKTCRNKKIREWQARNYDIVLAASRRWKARNPERIQAYSAQYWADNKEMCKSRRAAWMDAHPDMNAHYCRLREHRRRGAKGLCSLSQYKARWEFYGGLCYLCGAPADTIDHVIPLARGGSEWPANLRPACRSCNSAKGQRLPGELLLRAPQPPLPLAA